MMNIQTGTFSRCHRYLDDIGNINQHNIQALPKDVKEFLRDNTPARLKELAKMNCFAADKIKKELDMRYGQDNYIIVAIGRSLSSISELLSHMGVETKTIPLSGLRQGIVDNVRKSDLHIYKTFLVQKGLSKTDLMQNNGKKYILMDYTYYGRSLKKAEELLKKEELLGEADNITAIPVCDILGEDYEARHYKTLFSCCRFKNYASVGKLSINNLSDVYNVCSPERVAEYQGNTNKCVRKLFWFNVFDSIIRNDFKNIIPLKEVQAINEHYYSPKAISNYIRRERERICAI